MRRLSWILTLPLTVVVVVFAVANRSPVLLELWPFGLTVQAPLFLVILGSLFVGLLAGGAMAWLSGGGGRRRGRRARRRASDLQREVAQLRTDPGHPSPPDPPGASARPPEHRLLPRIHA